MVTVTLLSSVVAAGHNIGPSHQQEQDRVTVPLLSSLVAAGSRDQPNQCD